jgi:hypothetical protein
MERKSIYRRGTRPKIFLYFSSGRMVLVVWLLALLPLWQIVRQTSIMFYLHHHHHPSLVRHDKTHSNSIHDIRNDATSGSIEKQHNDFNISSVMISSSTTTTSRRRRIGGLLRFDWTSLELKSIMAQRMAEHQQSIDCSSSTANNISLSSNNRHPLHVGEFRFRNRYGLGSDLHLWTIALCNAMERNLRLHTILPWIFWDESSCGHGKGQQTASNSSSASATSSMSCYFPQAEPTCPTITSSVSPFSQNTNTVYKLYRGQGRISMECPTVIQSMGLSSSSPPSSSFAMDELFASGIEFLFSRVSPLVQQEAERQLRRVFSGNMNHTGRGPTSVSSSTDDAIFSVPPDLITVHVRWGDKDTEMKLVTMEEYIDAVKSIQRERGRPIEKAFIFLATEDPWAVKEMLAMAPLGWTIYIDQYFHDYSSHRSVVENIYNGNPLMSKALHGKPGLSALGSLLVAMEANDFVLTTQSNWSRLMNEIRTRILDPRCHNCTKMIDLRPAGEVKL